MLRGMAVSSLTTLFKGETADPTENDKLVDLFRNRAELKREFAALRNEKYRLQDRIKEHEGATARVQQQLGHLESLLLDPEWVYNVVAFYQLRRLAAHCENKLARFAEQLKQQREQREHGKLLQSWNQRCAKKSEAIQKKIGEHRLALQLLEDQLQSENHRLETMGGFAKLFKGRSLANQIEDISARIEAGHLRERALLKELDDVDKLDPPDQKGLDVAAKRSINFMILAFAQQLYLHFEEDNLAAMAKEASEKSVGAINYGGKKECDAIVSLLEKRREEAEQDTDFADVLKQRAGLIAELAMFREEEDAVPSPGTVATVFAIDRNGVIRQKDANLLGDNYFGIARVLSR